MHYNISGSQCGNCGNHCTRSIVRLCVRKYAKVITMLYIVYYLMVTPFEVTYKPYIACHKIIITINIGIARFITDPGSIRRTISN